MHLKRKLLPFLYLVLYVPILMQSQDSSRTWRVGIIGSVDIAYNFHNKLLNPGLQRKWTVGLSVTNKKRDFLAFMGVGIKGFKLDVYGQTFRSDFIRDVQHHYVAIADTNESQAIGNKMYSGDDNLWGTYSQHAEIGFMWLKLKWRPSVTFYMGRQEFLLHDAAFVKYEDPKYQDINYVGMTTMYYELKAGFGWPLKAHFR